MTALDERPAAALMPVPVAVPAPAVHTWHLTQAWPPPVTRVFDAFDWCPAWCAGHVDDSMPHTHHTVWEYFGPDGVVVERTDGQPARVSLADVDLTAPRTPEQSALLGFQIQMAERFAAIDGGDVVDAPDLSGPRISLAARPAAVVVHWARGVQAQCGSTEGRVTRIASVVDCPACRAWMEDQAWAALDQAADVPEMESVAQLAADRDQYAAESAGLREQLAAAVTTTTEQSALIGALRAQLHAAGLNPVGQGWQQRRIGVAA